MSVEFEWDQKKWNEFVNKIERNVNKAQIDRILAGVAYYGLKQFVAYMPKKTGELARSWHVNKENIDQYLIASNSKVSLFIEEGTRAHGPKTAKYLYIPLRPNAKVWRKGMIFGKDYILTKWVKGIQGIGYLKPISQIILNQMVEDFSNQLRK